MQQRQRGYVYLQSTGVLRGPVRYFVSFSIPWMAVSMMWLSHVFTSQTTSYMIFGLMHQRRGELNREEQQT